MKSFILPLQPGEGMNKIKIVEVGYGLKHGVLISEGDDKGNGKYLAQFINTDGKVNFYILKFRTGGEHFDAERKFKNDAEAIKVFNKMVEVFA